MHFITPLICGVCIFYTTLGGLKAVVWTDTFQFVITIGSMIAVLALGINATGGLGNVWKTAVEGHRLDIEYEISTSYGVYFGNKVDVLASVQIQVKGIRFGQ